MGESLRSWEPSHSAPQGPQKGPQYQDSAQNSQTWYLLPRPLKRTSLVTNLSSYQFFIYGHFPIPSANPSLCEGKLYMQFLCITASSPHPLPSTCCSTFSFHFRYLSLHQVSSAEWHGLLKGGEEKTKFSSLTVWESWTQTCYSSSDGAFTFPGHVIQASMNRLLC